MMIEFVLARLRRWGMRVSKSFGKNTASQFRISFCDYNTELVERLAYAFADVAAVEVL